MEISFLFERQTNVCLLEDWLYIPQVGHCSFFEYLLALARAFMHLAAAQPYMTSA